MAHNQDHGGPQHPRRLESSYKKIEGKIHPRTGHEGREGE